MSAFVVSCFYFVAFILSYDIRCASVTALAELPWRLRQNSTAFAPLDRLRHLYSSSSDLQLDKFRAIREFNERETICAASDGVRFLRAEHANKLAELLGDRPYVALPVGDECSVVNDCSWLLRMAVV